MAVRSAVVGVGQTKHAKCREDLSLAGLVREAAVRALELIGREPPAPSLSAPIWPEPPLARQFAAVRSRQARLEAELYPPD